MSTPAQVYDNKVVAVAGSDGMHDLQIAAGITAGQSFNAGSLVSLTTAGALSKGCGDANMPLWAINGTADLDVYRDDGIMGGGNVNCYVATGGFELFTSAYDSASTNTYSPTKLLTAATGDDLGKVTLAAVTGYNDRIVLGVVSRGVSADQYNKNVLYFWPVFIPKVSNTASV